MKRVLITTILICSFLFAGTTLAIFYAKGYLIIPYNGRIRLAGTGILSTSSIPSGAKVFVDGTLVTATENSINLSPGTYQVKIVKDGYFPWEKKIVIEKEIVSPADALLFPIAPKLEALTTTGAEKPRIDDSRTMIAYTTASNSAEKNGIYVLDMNSRSILSIGRSARQIVDNRIDTMSLAKIEFSPDSTQLIASMAHQGYKSSYLLSTSSFNQIPQIITEDQILQIEQVWQAQKAERHARFLASLSTPLQSVVTTQFTQLLPSPDADKILYEASKSATLPILLSPRLPGSNSTPEERTITKGNLYIYDIKEDRNYLVLDKKGTEQTSQLIWHPDSKHLIFVQERKINIMDYDGINKTTVYSGPFLDEFVVPWPDGSNLLILTNLNNPHAPHNLYRIGLK